MKSLYIIIVSTCAYLFSGNAFGATITAVSNGNWTSNSTWSCNCQPSSSDNVVIPATRLVTVSSAVILDFGPLISITVGGTLKLMNGSIAIDPSDVVNVLSGGKIIGAGLLGGSVWSGLTDIPVTSGSEIDGPKTISNGVLPIKLIYFKSTIEDDGIRLQWVSGEEINFDHYDIARSNDGKLFTSIATIPGKDPNGAEYTFTDTSPAATNYYKLTAVDIDGSRDEMSVIKSEWNDQREWITIYPNPVSDGTIHIRFSESGNASLQLFACSGLVVVQSLMINALTSDIGLPPNIPPGVYFVSVQTDTRNARIKLVVK